MFESSEGPNIKLNILDAQTIQWIGSEGRVRIEQTLNVTYFVSGLQFRHSNFPFILVDTSPKNNLWKLIVNLKLFTTVSRSASFNHWNVILAAHLSKMSAGSLVIKCAESKIKLPVVWIVKALIINISKNSIDIQDFRLNFHNSEPRAFWFTLSNMLSAKIKLAV